MSKSIEHKADEQVGHGIYNQKIEKKKEFPINEQWALAAYLPQLDTPLPQLMSAAHGIPQTDQ